LGISEGEKLRKFRVVYSISYDIEAEDNSEATDKAEKKMSDDFGEGFTNIIAMNFGCNVEEV